MRGAEGHGANVVNCVLLTIALVWLFARALAPGAPLRRHRFETQALSFLAVIFVLVAMFFREHRDYQFSLLVPLYALPWATFLDRCARRWIDAWVPAWLAAVLFVLYRWRSSYAISDSSSKTWRARATRC
jgi:hypothetical protein